MSCLTALFGLGCDVRYAPRHLTVKSPRRSCTVEDMREWIYYLPNPNAKCQHITPTIDVVVGRGADIYHRGRFIHASHLLTWFSLRQLTSASGSRTRYRGI